MPARTLVCVGLVSGVVLATGCGSDAATPDAEVSPPEWLAYDDGSAETADSPCETVAGGQIAVRFTPAAYPVTVEAVSFFVGEGGKPATPFGVHVYDDDGGGGLPGTDLLAAPLQASAPAVSRDAVVVELTGEPIVISDGDFFVAMEWLIPASTSGGKAQFLSADTSDPDGRTYWNWGVLTRPEWQEISAIGSRPEDRDAMIRARLRATR